MKKVFSSGLNMNRLEETWISEFGPNLTENILFFLDMHFVWEIRYW